MPCFKKSVSFFGAIALLFSCLFPAYAGDFPIISPWAQAEIAEAEKEGLLPYELTENCSRPLNRRQSAAFVVKFVEVATKAEITEYEQGVFSDTSSPDAEKAFAIGITKGTEDGSTFSPTNNVTREEYATMLYRAFQFIENTLKVDVLPSPVELSNFEDGDEIADWAVEALGIFAGTAIIKGTAEGTISPAEPISLEQACIISHRSLTFFNLNT